MLILSASTDSNLKVIMLCFYPYENAIWYVFSFAKSDNLRMLSKVLNKFLLLGYARERILIFQIKTPLMSFSMFNYLGFLKKLRTSFKLTYENKKRMEFIVPVCELIRV
jgi:hypothetical protein